MSALPRIVDRLRAGGWRIGLGIKIAGDAAPPPDMLAELQAEREAVLRALVEETLAAPLSAPAPDLVATILETFPQSTVVGEAEPLGVVVRRLLAEGAGVEPSDGGGYRLTLPDGRSLAITAEGCATLDEGLLGDLAERVAIATEHLARPPSWASLDPPPQGAWCLACHGGRFWREREAPRGWRCASCHPPDHLSVAVVTAP